MSTEQGEDLKNINPESVVEEELQNEVHEEVQDETTEQVPSLNIGEILKQARLERNLSLKVISQHTKISTTMLEHLEENRFNDLPSKAYVIGFVKSYSKTVGLDTNECLLLLNDAYGVVPEPEVNHIVESLPPRSENSNTSDSQTTEIPSQYLTIAGVFAALIIVVVIAINSTENSVKEEITAKETIEKETKAIQTPLVNVKPQEVTEQTPLTEAEKVKPVEVKKTEEVAEVKPVEKKTEPVVKKAEVKKEEKKLEAVAKKPEVKEEVIKEKKKVEVKKEITLRPLTLPLYTVTNNKDALTHLPEKFKNSLIAGKQNIFINAVDGDTWITYKSDDNAIKKFVLKQGRTLLIRGDVIRIFLGNINVARVFLNNQPLKITSRSGVKSLVFPQEQAKDYKLPLFIYNNNGKAITSQEYEANL